MPDNPDVSKPTRFAAWHVWWPQHWRFVVGSGLLAASIIALVYMALLASSTTPPTAVESVLLVVIASGLQIASAGIFNGNGRADPSLARSAVRRLIALTAHAGDARRVAEKAEFETPELSQKAMGRLSVQLSYIEEGVAEAAKDWAEFHPAAIKKLEEVDQ